MLELQFARPASTPVQPKFVSKIAPVPGGMGSPTVPEFEPKNFM